ncbi:MAG: hypothetical protein A49_30280 [Methyloceanibacter sp.]|nr:MAG: hypothetical protein A49_30280 [Methyloceanibacter sp.]
MLLERELEGRVLERPEGNIAKAEKFLEQQHAKAASGQKVFTETDVNARVEQVIDERSKGDVFVFHDPKLDTDLKLKFEEIKIVRGMEGYGWFANVIFHDVDEPKKQYAIDFWFKPEGDQLTLMDIRVQKGPKRDGDGYFMISRLPVAWWWLPVQEHPGSIEGARAWQVMAAIHDYILENKDADGNITVKDDKTGEDVKLQFVEMHRPVRHLKGEGKYFACTDFRKPGSKDEYYDLDFWVDEKERRTQGRRRQDPQGSGSGRRNLDSSRSLHIRRHGLRGYALAVPAHRRLASKRLPCRPGPRRGRKRFVLPEIRLEIAKL